MISGVVRPYSQIPVFWRYWMYWVNPSTWWIGGVLAATLKDIPVQCTASETAHFNPPPGRTCEGYAGNYATRAGGYLLNPTATADCQYCQYYSGNEYLSSLNIHPSQKWRDFGIFLVFVFTNWMLVYFFIWSVRVKGWGFGFGTLFRFLGKGVALAKKPFAGRKKVEGGEGQQ